MSFWTREIVGWVVMALGLFVFYSCYVLLLNGRPIEAGPMVIIGIFLFRGGIHLLKVAVAANVCMQTQDQLSRERPPARLPHPQRRGHRPTPGGRRA